MEDTIQIGGASADAECAKENPLTNQRVVEHRRIAGAQRRRRTISGEPSPIYRISCGPTLRLSRPVRCCRRPEPLHRPSGLFPAGWRRRSLGDGRGCVLGAVIPNRTLSPRTSTMVISTSSPIMMDSSFCLLRTNIVNSFYRLVLQCSLRKGEFTCSFSRFFHIPYVLAAQRVFRTRQIAWTALDVPGPASVPWRLSGHPYFG